jgi:hypothetical protein
LILRRFLFRLTSPAVCIAEAPKAILDALVEKKQKKHGQVLNLEFSRALMILLTVE